MRLTSWIRKLAFVAIIWSVALVVLLAGAELVLRVTDDGWGRTLRLNIIRNRTYDFSVARLYDSATRPCVIIATRTGCATIARLRPPSTY